MTTDALTEAARPRFLADEGFNRAITEGLRRRYPDMDLLMLQEAHLLHTPDPQLLLVAQQFDRVLLTHDARTMPGFFYNLLGRLPPGEHHPGVLLVPQETAIGVASSGSLKSGKRAITRSGVMHSPGCRFERDSAG